MDNNEKLSLMVSVTRYAIDKGYEVHMIDNDQKATITEVASGGSQFFADNGFSIRLYPFIVDGIEEDDEDSVAK